MMINKFLKNLLLVLGFVSLAYIFICNIFLVFSISVTLCFVAFAVLLFALHYVLDNPINKEEREPSFIYTFIKVSTCMYFGFMIFVVLFNIFYPKNYIDKNSNYDYIIVFGAGIKNGKNEIINGRLDKAVEYSKKYPKCRFVLTGAKGKDEPIEEAYYMSNYMRERGVDENNVIVDPFSINTYENVNNALELIMNDVKRRNLKEKIITRPFNVTIDNFDLDFLNIGFMSNDFHLSRINMMARKKGIDKPYDILCITNILYKPYMYIRENLSFIKAIVLNQLKI